MITRPLFAEAHEGAYRGGRGVEDTDLILLDDLPEAVGFGPSGRAFVHQRRGAVLQRAIDYVAVAGDPSDIGRTPEGVFFTQIEDPFAGDIGADGISAGGV